MSVLFPPIQPTSRTYTAPEYAQLNPQYLGVVSYPRLLGSKPGKAKLSLTFENIPDSSAALIIAAWMNSLTGFLPLVLPPEIVSGVENSALATRIQTGQHLDWFFDGPPKQNSVIKGISTVQVDLAGDIAGLNNLDTSKVPEIEIGQTVPASFIQALNQAIQATPPGLEKPFNWGTGSYTLVYQVSAWTYWGRIPSQSIGGNIGVGSGGQLQTFTVTAVSGIGGFSWQGAGPYSSTDALNGSYPATARTYINLGTQSIRYYGLNTVSPLACPYLTTDPQTVPYFCWDTYTPPAITVVSITRTA